MNEEKLIKIIRDGATLEQTHQIIEYIRKLQNNWNELDKWLIEKLKEYQKSKYPGEYGLVLGFMWEMQRKMQELEGKNE